MKFGIIPKILKQQDGSHLNQYLVVAAATISLFTTGIHLSWCAPSLPKLLSPEYPFEISQEEASYIAIVSPIGHVTGGFLFSYLNDAIGRKGTVLLTAVPQIISFTLIVFSFYGKYFLYAARVIGGMSEGACLALLPSYVAEITDPAVRGRLGTMVAVTCLSGNLFINVLGSFVSIYLTAAICLTFPIIFLIVFSFTPESPYYLMMKNRTDEAEAALKTLRRKSNVDIELLQLTADVRRQMSETGTYRDLFTIDSNRKAFWIAVATRSFQQLTGICAFASYFQIMLGEATDISPALSTSLLMLIQILSSVTCTFYINRFGRKTIFGWSSFVSSLALAAFAVHITIRDYSDLDVSNISWLPLVYLIIFTIAFQCGLGVAVNIYIGEIFSTSIKAKGFSLMSLVFAIYMVVTIKFYQFTVDNIGLALPLWIFATSTFLGTWFFVFVLPETKGKSLEIIQQELKGNKTIKT